MGIGKGTKLTDTPKDKMLRVRIDSDTEQKLNAVCNFKQKSKSDIVREGIEQQYTEIQNK